MARNNVVVFIIILGSGINPVSDLGPRASYNAPGYEQFRGLPKENKVTSLQLKSLWGNHPVGHEGTNLQQKKVISCIRCRSPIVAALQFSHIYSCLSSITRCP